MSSLTSKQVDLKVFEEFSEAILGPLLISVSWCIRRCAKTLKT